MSSVIAETFEKKNIRFINKTFLEMFGVSIPFIEGMMYENNICTWKVVKKENCFFLKWSIDQMDKLVGALSYSCILDTVTTDTSC
jgi:hypothetical protein